MDNEKIGKFIAKCRKDKDMTQSQLAERLGVTDKSIGNWENGRNMPDLSLFQPLCKELGISINDLMSGEKVSKDNYQQKFEENIVNTINYSKKRINKYHYVISLMVLIFGLFIALSAIMIFPSESSWGAIYSQIGIIIFVIGIAKLTKPLKSWPRILIVIFVFFISMGLLRFTDYINVKLNNIPPRFRITSTYLGSDIELMYYDTLFYDVIKCSDKYEIVKNKKYSHEELFDYCSKR